MKTTVSRLVRIIALFTATLCLCVSLCGCKEIDEARAMRAFYMEDGNIIWKNRIYYRTDRPRGVNMDISYDFDEENYTYLQVNIAEDDVPLLLLPFYGKTYDVCNGGTIIEDVSDDALYCHKEIYEQIQYINDNGFTPTRCGYTYEVPDEDEYSVTESYYLTDEEWNIVQYALKTSPRVWREIYVDTSVSLMQYGDTDIFYDDYANIYVSNNNVFIESATDGIKRQVSSLYYDTFCRIVEKQQKADELWERYYEEYGW